jgi:hypothetical protein
MKFGINAMPLHTTPDLYFLISTTGNTNITEAHTGYTSEVVYDHP